MRRKGELKKRADFCGLFLISSKGELTLRFVALFRQKGEQSERKFSYFLLDKLSKINLSPLFEDAQCLISTCSATTND
ncbi:hypothetical protein VIBHAR_06326 [Vibrio campbellii ATCC BAA-1116]|uniref:Uncharacterized protein n=1 Tax=Vibrio campbellii (strain ATCC BAA-1116) TaxID=2902295 RepID=A7N3P9_VIBC1|nr:hypothetical protein VIBHAR_06326 [Vibrio campbellii ATCC BAA-1116]